MIVGGIVLRIKDFPETIAWNAHSSEIANFMQLGDIKTIWEGRGDQHDGTITFDPVNKQIIVNTDYFSFPYKAIKFWRGIGFDIVLKGCPSSAEKMTKEKLE